eukprot:5453649-Pyramimonas_sp.AAC.2
MLPSPAIGSQPGHMPAPYLRLAPGVGSAISRISDGFSCVCGNAAVAAQVLARMTSVAAPTQAREFEPRTDNGAEITKENATDGALLISSTLTGLADTRSKDNGDATVDARLDEQDLDRVLGWFRDYKRYNCLKARASWATNDTYFQTVVNEGCAFLRNPRFRLHLALPECIRAHPCAGCSLSDVTSPT